MQFTEQPSLLGVQLHEEFVVLCEISGNFICEAVHRNCYPSQISLHCEKLIRNWSYHSELRSLAQMFVYEFAYRSGQPSELCVYSLRCFSSLTSRKKDVVTFGFLPAAYLLLFQKYSSDPTSQISMKSHQAHSLNPFDSFTPCAVMKGQRIERALDRNYSIT